MWYLRTAREVAGIAKDLWWLAEMATEMCTRPTPPGGAEIEMVERYAECRPPAWDEPVWSTEAEEWDSGWSIVRSSNDDSADRAQ